MARKAAALPGTTKALAAGALPFNCPSTVLATKSTGTLVVLVAASVPALFNATACSARSFREDSARCTPSSSTAERRGQIRDPVIDATGASTPKASIAPKPTT
jgi:hypothetical protein